MLYIGLETLCITYDDICNIDTLYSIFNTTSLLLLHVNFTKDIFCFLQYVPSE